MKCIQLRIVSGETGVADGSFLPFNISIRRGKKRLGCLTEMTIDTSHDIITGVDCYPANQRENDIILNHLKGQFCEYQEIGLDGGYDIGTVYRGLEILGINGYTVIPEYQNNAMKKGFCYDAEKDRFVCM